MQTVRSLHAMQKRALAWKGDRLAIGFVPTMGYLHEGHISLVHRARQRVGPQGKVVVSIYVNPTQFAANEDLSKYPRDLKRDQALCREAGVDVVFFPDDQEMYPQGYSTYVVEEALTRGMEGEARPTHFRGVTTIVAKLFNCVLPDVAVFGAKDFQQAAVISRMAKDLNFPVKVVVAPTRRETDGLAMSSRNKYLSPDERQQATVLFRCLREARTAVREKAMPAARLKATLAGLIAEHPATRIDYIEIFDPQTFLPQPVAKPGQQMALAVFVGKTRLIDNGRL